MKDKAKTVISYYYSINNIFIFNVLYSSKGISFFSKLRFISLLSLPDKKKKTIIKTYLSDTTIICNTSSSTQKTPMINEMILTDKGSTYAMNILINAYTF